MATKSTRWLQKSMSDFVKKHKPGKNAGPQPVKPKPKARKKTKRTTKKV